MKTVNTLEEVSQNFIDAAYDTNTNRAFPSASDGLKPGQRCILWEMYTKGYTSNKPHVKSAKVSGGVAASWHPHGTSAIYETFVHMSQPFTNSNPEVDFHGANGNVILGDSYAADRYSETRLAPITEQGMLQGIDKNAVDMKLNFSEDLEMPVVLPAYFPRLLCNGSQGLGYGMANFWCTHNLKETAAMLEKYLDTGEVDEDNYFPDFPTGATIVNKKDLPQINKTGKGKVIMEAKYEIDGKDINFTNLPYQVYVEPVIEEIKANIKKDKVHNVKNIMNKSDKNRVLLTVTAKSTDFVKQLLVELLTYTSLRSQINVNQMAIVSKTPTLLTLADMCRIYEQHNLNCIKREFTFDLNKTKERLEILEGLQIAQENIDDVIEIIRKSKTPDEARTKLEKKYSLTQEQSKNILAMRLSRLSHLEKTQIEDELSDKRKEKNRLENIVNSKGEQKMILKERLRKLAEKFGSNRKSEIVEKEVEKVETKVKKNEYDNETYVVVLTDAGYLKRIPLTQFRNTSINKKNISLKADELVVLFSTKGLMYRIKCGSIKKCGNSDKGVGIGALINLAEDEHIISICKSSEEPQKMVVVTNKFYSKVISEKVIYGTTQNKRGSKYITLTDDDTVTFVNIFYDSDSMLIVTSDGRGGLFDINTFTVGGPTSKGFRLMKFYEDKEESIAHISIRPSSIQALAVGDKRIAVPRRKKGSTGVFKWLDKDQVKMIGE